MPKQSLSKKAFKKVKKKSVSWWKKKAWKVFSEFIRRRSGGVCYTCGYKTEWKNLQGSHYIPKSLSQNLLFNEINVQACCVRCNMWLLGNLDEFNRRLVLDYGQAEVDRLRLAKNVSKSWSIQELQNLIKKYELN